LLDIPNLTVDMANNQNLDTDTFKHQLALDMDNNNPATLHLQLTLDTVKLALDTDNNNLTLLLQSALDMVNNHILLQSALDMDKSLLQSALDTVNKLALDTDKSPAIPHQLALDTVK